MIYVDDMYTSGIGNFGRMKMSHMVADSTEELLAMVRKIGVDEKWIQHKGEGTEHFDIAISKRKLAIANGAISIGMRVLAVATVARKSPNEKLILIK